MLGRLRRTTRLDVGLAIAFAGLAYLVWALVAGVSRGLMLEMDAAIPDKLLVGMTRVVKVFFFDTGFVIDVVGLAWLTGSLVLILLGSRQRVGISWAWACAIMQSIAAALGGIWVAWAIQRPYVSMLTHAPAAGKLNHAEQLSMISLPVLVPVALLIWTLFVVWLLVERSRWKNRRGPSMNDMLRTNVYR